MIRSISYALSTSGFRIFFPFGLYLLDCLFVVSCCCQCPGLMNFIYIYIYIYMVGQGEMQVFALYFYLFNHLIGIAISGSDTPLIADLYQYLFNFGNFN